MNDWLSLPSGEMVRISEIASVEDRPPPAGRHSRVAELVFKNGRTLLTPWSLTDVQWQIRDIEKKVTGEVPGLEWHLSPRVRAAYENYKQVAWDASRGTVTLAEWLGMVAEDYLALQAQSSNPRAPGGIGYDGGPGPGPGE